MRIRSNEINLCQWHVSPFPSIVCTVRYLRDSKPKNCFSQNLLSSGFQLISRRWETLAWDVEDRRQTPWFLCWQQLISAWTSAEWKFYGVLWHSSVISCRSSAGDSDHWQQYPAVPTLGINSRVLVLWRLQTNLTARCKPPCPLLLPINNCLSTYLPVLNSFMRDPPTVAPDWILLYSSSSPLTFTSTSLVINSQPSCLILFYIKSYILFFLSPITFYPSTTS